MFERVITERSHGLHKTRLTSVDAYLNLQNIRGKHKEVYNAIKMFNEQADCPTDLQIAEYLGYADPNKVRPRRKELFDKGLIEEVGVKVCPISTRTVMCWRVFDVQPIFKKKENGVLEQINKNVPKVDWLRLKMEMERQGYSYLGNGCWGNKNESKT